MSFLAGGAAPLLSAAWRQLRLVLLLAINAAEAVLDWIHGLVRPDLRRAEDNVWLQGNFGPVHDERFDADLPVVGKMPRCLNGEFVRNGPNPQHTPSGFYHWFDGDGMLHGVRILNGKVNYVNHWIRTDKFNFERETGRKQKVLLGDMRGFIGLLKIMLHGLKEKLHIAPHHATTKTVAGLYRNGTANTSVQFHDGRLLAAVEADLPMWVLLLIDGQMETVGQYHYSGKLNHPFTAHSKIDTKTGEMLFFGYDFLRRPYLTYSIAGKGGELKFSTPITLPRPTMMHDFAVTERYAIFMDLPLVFDPPAMVRNGVMPFVFKSELKSRFGILPRNAKTEEGIKWFESEPCYVFHVAASWDDESTNEVVLVACRIGGEGFAFNLDSISQSDKESYMTMQPNLYEWRFNLDTGAVKERYVGNHDRITCEFPRVHPDLACRQAQYVYAASFKDQSSLLFDGIIKVDLQANKVVQRMKFGPGNYGGEPVFVPTSTSDDFKEREKQKQAEDDGHLMTFVYSEEENTSFFKVYRAQDLQEVASVRLPRRVPYGFHGIFVPEGELGRQRPLPS